MNFNIRNKKRKKKFRNQEFFSYGEKVNKFGGGYLNFISVKTGK